MFCRAGYVLGNVRERRGATHHVCCVGRVFAVEGEVFG